VVKILKLVTGIDVYFVNKFPYGSLYKKRSSKMKKFVAKSRVFIVLVLFGFIGTLAFAQTNERNRGFYIDAGISVGVVSHGNDVDHMLKSFNDLYIPLDGGIGLNIGWAAMQNLYVIGSFSFGQVTMYHEDIGIYDYLNLSRFFLGAGIRYYPLSSMKHLQTGADLGLYILYFNTNVPNDYSKLGPALKLSAAYDFDSTMTGPALLLGGELLLGIPETAPTIGFTLFAKFVFK
jgi:hypothetical protein